MVKQSSTSIEELLESLRDPQTLDKINYMLNQKGIPTNYPCLRIEVDTDKRMLEFEPGDLQELFSNFGSVESITISPTRKNSAIIIFKDIVSAYLAQQSLHMYYLPTYHVRLNVKWNIVEDSHLLDHSVSRAQFENPFNSGSELESNVDTFVSREHIGKYICRFYIQIENDRSFQVTRRVIGPKGRNMKNILDACSKGCVGRTQEVVKLRLRGRGSGFKEGPNHQESDEPLHLCVSSPYLQKYKEACEMCKELLNNVYTKYKEFCERRGKSKPHLQIRMVENVMNGIQYRGYEQYPPKDSTLPYSAYYYPSMSYYNTPYKQHYPNQYKYSPLFNSTKPTTNNRAY